MTEDILYEEDRYIGKIILNRPKKLNAITIEMYKEIARLIEKSEEKDHIRVIVISGAGKAFSAGFDLSVPASNNAKGVRKLLYEANSSRWAIWNSSKPTIAKIQGYCLGGAFQIMLCCDFAIASGDSLFGEPEVKSAEPTNFPILPWVVGMRAAKKLAFLGELIDAKEATHLGLINECVPKEHLDEAVTKLANRLARIPANTLKVLKLGINKGYELRGFRDTIDYSIELSLGHHFSRSEEEIEFGKIVREKGLKEALTWREKQFNVGE